MLLEICIDSFNSATAAKSGGADRLEVCSALAVGGTTPANSLLEQCVHELGMPCMMMIRPHDGGFVYDVDDVRTMIGSVQQARSIGVQGIVFGALTPDRNIDLEACKRLLDAADGLESTFHRAIDVANDVLGTLAQLESLGIDRVLTSGQRSTAIEGAETIRQMVQQSTSIKILAGSGVNASNVVDLIEQTGVHEVHASASIAATESQSNDHVSFGQHRRVTCSEKVGEIKANLEGR
ncbi:copper homeostasis protein CutC [Mariniblastus fucicola]|uniref:PF03932 family protein CutC n=1 Tax=Mariniblastus fucicola TaxID=980251 RepID=A0A5B9PSQ5_9BACT|nr:copper homeostasis protein CutC [Mariniblastus fucicola]QEG25263.1 Copper homeostasis protein CutC [Mariniblastus fucicola]